MPVGPDGTAFRSEESEHCSLKPTGSKPLPQPQLAWPPSNPNLTIDLLKAGVW
jgi:hypothetical protein